MMVKESWKTKGFVDEAIDKSMDLKSEIRRMAQEKNAVVLAHFYCPNEVQDVADFIGDSLALAQWAAKTDAKIIVMCGVHFMAETDKILCPDKLVLTPDLNAGCSLADSCNAEDLKKYKEDHPGYQVVSYVNTTAAVKALTDVVVTSSNAKKIIDTFPQDAKIIFGPDYNLGSYINQVTGRKMLLWNGGCHVHSRFSVERILELKKKYPDAEVLAHPECKGPVLAISDFVGSTAAILKYAVKSAKNTFIVATESGILHQMQKECPDKTFIPAPPEISEDTIGCSCNECNFMKLNTIEKVYNCLKYEWPSVDVDSEIAKEAVKPIKRMLELS
jgi:quinolinate synthase